MLIANLSYFSQRIDALPSPIAIVDEILTEENSRVIRIGSVRKS